MTSNAAGRTHQSAGRAQAAPFRADAAPVPLVLRACSADGASRAGAVLRGRLGARLRPTAQSLSRALATANAGTGWRTVVLGTPEALPERLAALAEGRKASGVVGGPGDGGKVAMVFPGHGAHWPGMAHELMAASPAFEATMAACDAAMRPFVNWSLLDVLADAPGTPPLDTPDVAQPALFAVMVSLAELWRACGIEPDMVIGHSLGETAAVHVAGGLSLSDALQLVCVFGRGQRSLFGQGEMLWVRATEAEMRQLLSETGSAAQIAAVNGPQALLVAGSVDAVQELVPQLRAHRVRSRPLDIGLAAHTSQVDAFLSWVSDELTPVHPEPVRIPVYSSLLGGLAPADTSYGLAYWCRNMRSQMRFHQAMMAAYQDGCRIAIEVSPHPVLTSSFEESATSAGVPVFVSETLRHGDGRADHFLGSLAGVFVHGAEPDWAAVVGATPEDDAAVPADVRAALERPEPEPESPAASPPARTIPPDGRVAFLTELVCIEAAAVLGGIRTVGPDLAFADLGFDSTAAISLSNRLTAQTGLHLPATLLFDYPTASAVARFMDQGLGGTSPKPQASDDRHRTTVATDSAEPIAIVGMACRFAGADNPGELWRNLVEARDTVAGLPTDRGWDITGRFDRTMHQPGTFYQREGGFLPDAGGFDAAFFGISPREALAMDPQQRILLETSWEALESAGIDALGLRGSQTGTFVGLIPLDYGPRADEATPDLEGYVLTGSAASVASGRISYVLGLEGPALTVDTACSSSLVAIHLAMNSLRRNECDLALAGGATVLPNLNLLVGFSRQRALAQDGRCKAFGAGADGFALAEGSGMVVLERLSVARERGHQVLAVLRGSAVNQDGASNGLTAPNGPSQRRVIQAALADAGLEPQDVDAVEAHGTGTHLGDPIEAQALLATYGRNRPADRPLWLGSVKSNIGHTQAAAGVAGVIKMVCALRAAVLPATLHVNQPSAEVDWSSGTVNLLSTGRDWTADGRPRRAGVSAFGISGTNAHVILEQAPETAVPGDGERPTGPDEIAWVLSARTEHALQQQARRLRERLAAEPDCRPADVATTLASGRAALPCRAVLVGDPPALRRGLDALAESGTADMLGRAGPPPGRLALMFTGQGSQRVGMGQQLYRSVSAFAEAFDEVCAALDPYLDRPLRTVIWDDQELLDQTSYTQAALFAVEVSLFRLVRAWGIRPDYLIGHSIGELAAAHAAGVLSLPDAAALVAARGRLMQAMPAGGVMVAAQAAESDVVPLLAGLTDRVSIAAVNGPASVVLSGTRAAVEAVVRLLNRDGVRCQPLNVSHAFHSPLMEPMLADFERVASEISFHEPNLPVVSNLTGRLADGDDLRSAKYWVRHVRAAVRYHDGVTQLRKLGVMAFVELGPGGVLAGLTRTCLSDQAPDAVVAPALPRRSGEIGSMLRCLGRLWTHGHRVDWAAIAAGSAGVLVDLPTYPFQHRRFWLDPTPTHRRRSATGSGLDAPFWDSVTRQEVAPLCRMLGVDDGDRFETVVPAMAHWLRRQRDLDTVNGWRHRIVWSSAPTATSPQLAGRWLLICPEGQVSESLADAVGGSLRDCGASLTPISVTGPDRLLDQLARSGCDGPVAGVVSLLGLDRRPHPTYPYLPSGLAATLHLVHALVETKLAAPLWCLTQGAVCTGPADPPAEPSAAGLWGLGQVVGLELPEHWGGLVDLPGDFACGPDQSALASVLSGAIAEDQAALRSGTVLGRRLRPAALPAPTPPRWRACGTALITGGTGALGSHVARWLAANGAEHIVVTSRRGGQAPGAAELEAELTALGVGVTLAGVDVADRAACASLIADVHRRHGPIRTVVHAAGVLRAVDLVDSSLDDLSAMAAGKLVGGCNLDELLDDAEVDAFVLFSSNAGVWGGRGLAGYAAANVGLDALAERRRARGAKATAVAWGMWAGGGLGTEQVAERLARDGMLGMDPALAILALHQALDLDETLLSVAEVDWATFLPRYAFARPRPLISELPEAQHLAAADPESEPTGQPAHALVRQLAELSVPERQDLLLRIVREQAAQVLCHEGIDEVAADETFRDLGFESLTAVEFRNHLAAATGLRLPATAVFDHPTPTLLTAELLRRLAPADPANGEPTTEARLRAALAEIPIERLRHAGLLDRLLRLAGRDAETQQQQSGRPGPADSDIDEFDAEHLVQLALGEQ